LRDELRVASYRVDERLDDLPELYLSEDELRELFAYLEDDLLEEDLLFLL
jgi:hypothetical protein